MADDIQRTPKLVDDLRTTEYTVPLSQERDGELMVASILASSSDRVQEARQLIVCALREIESSGPDDRRRARLHHTLGLLIEYRLADSRRALTHYLEACRLAPGEVAAIRTARRLLWTKQNWTMVLKLIDDELAATANPTRQSALLLQKGRVLEERLMNSERARDAYRQALQLDPSNRQVLHRLRRVHGRQRDVHGLLEICRRTAAATRDRELRCLMLSEMARIFEELSEIEAAISSYATAFKEEPSLTMPRAALKRLYHQHGRWGDLVGVLLAEGGLAGAGSPSVQSYLAAARLCRDRLGQPERALEIFGKIMQAVRNDTSVLKEMAELLGYAGRYSDLAEVYQQMLECLESTPERVLTHYQLGRVLEDRLGREDEAIIHYRRAVSLDATYVPALQSLGKLYQRRGLWAELIAMHAAEAEIAGDAESRAARFCSLAALCETQLHDLPRAVEHHRRALEEKPHYIPAERALERLYATTQNWAELIELLVSQLEALRGDAAAAQHVRIGEIYEEREGDLDRAIQHHRRALELRPEAVSTVRALQRLYAKTERYADLLVAIDQEALLTHEPGTVVALMHQAAELCENQLQRPDEAVARYRKILQLAPSHGPTLSSLGRTYQRQRNWDEVLTLYRVEVEQRATPAARLGSLLFKMGEIYLEQLGDEESALNCYSRALDAVPTYSPALQALASLHRRREEWDRLLAVLRRQAELLGPEQRASALASIGELCEARLGQQALAVQHYRQALELCPSQELALCALLRILSAEQRWREVTELYGRAIGAALDDRSRVCMLKQLGDIWNERLTNPARAIDCYSQALEISPDDLEALDALGRIMRSSGELERLADIYERLALRAKDPSDAVSYLYDAAAIVEAGFPEKDVVPLYQRVIEQQPEEEIALEALGRGALEHSPQGASRICEAQLRLEEDPVVKSGLLFLLAETLEAAGDLSGAEQALKRAVELSDDWVVARELRRVRERLGMWEGVAESLETEADRSRSRGLLLESLMRAASLYQDRFQDLDRAVGALERVLELDPFHEEAAVRLEQILVKRESWPELVEVLRRRLVAAAGGAKPSAGNAVQALIELLSRMAWIQREHLQQPDEAIATLIRAAELDPHHLPTLLTLGELYLSQEQWTEVVEVYSQIVRMSDDPDVLRSAHFRLGDVWSERLGDVPRAISSYQNVLTIAPDDAAALSKLLQIFTSSKDWENASDIVTRLIEVETEPQLLVGHYATLAEIQESGFGDARSAAEQLQQALSINPGNELILGRFLRLCTQLGDWEALSESIRSYLAALPTEQEGRGIAYRVQLGHVLQERMGRTGEALEQFRVVVEIDPTHVEARQSIAAILAEAGNHEEAISEHREVQLIEGVNLESLRRMRVIWSRMGDQELAYASAATLVCLGEATEAEAQIYREHRARGVRFPVAPPDPVQFERSQVHPGENTSGRRVLAILAEVAHRLRPAQLSEWQVTKADRLPPRSEDPVKVLAREVGAALGMDREIEIFISPARSREMDLLLTDPPSLVVGAGVMGALSPLEVRCWMGQLLSYVRHRVWAAYGMSGAQLRQLIRGACIAAEPERPFVGMESDTAVETARAIQRNLSRRGRRALEETCAGLSGLRESEAAEWALAMQHTAMRSALWVANDLETALGVLRRADPALAKSGEGPALTPIIRRSVLATELIHYWLSDEHAALKRSSL